MIDCYRSMTTLLPWPFSQGKRWGTMYTLELLCGISTDFNWNQTFAWLLPLCSLDFLTLLQFSVWKTYLRNLLHINLHPGICFWNVSTCVFILKAEVTGNARKWEDHGMAWHLPHPPSSTDLEPQSRFASGRRYYFINYVLRFWIMFMVIWDQGHTLWEQN